MRTIAIRLEESTAELISLVAQLEGTSIIDQIRTAIEAHLEQKLAKGDLAARAQAVVQEIDREAAAKKAAIGELFDRAAQAAPAPKAPARRRSKAGEQAHDDSGQVTAEALPMGFAPPARRRRGGQ